MLGAPIRARSTESGERSFSCGPEPRLGRPSALAAAHGLGLLQRSVRGLDIPYEKASSPFPVRSARSHRTPAGRSARTGISAQYSAIFAQSNPLRCLPVVGTRLAVWLDTAPPSRRRPLADSQRPGNHIQAPLPGRCPFAGRRVPHGRGGLFLSRPCQRGQPGPSRNQQDLRAGAFCYAPVPQQA
jgi:hypothetical protein